MSHYLFIQSQDSFTEVRSDAQYDLAGRLAEAGHQVRLFLVQNGVSAARKGATCPAFDKLSDKVSVLADRFSLEQREIADDQLKSVVSAATIDLVIEAMLAGEKVIWN